MTLVLRYAARSDRGLVRSNNQDSVYAGPRLLAVADGMGGHAAGEVASKVVIAALAPLDDDEPGDDLLSQLSDAVTSGNNAISELVADDPELEGMGTTLTAMLFSSGKFGVAHVGDSRAYMLRDDVFSKITHDDSFVQKLQDEGRITEEEAETHPQRSLLLKALTGQQVEPSLTVREARAGDRYLLCSDGLSGMVSKDTLDEAVRIKDVGECADRMVELALKGGGTDNVTVIVADVVDVDYGDDAPIVGGAAGNGDDERPPSDSPAARAQALLPPKQAEPQRVGAEPDAGDEPKKKKPWFKIGLIALVVLAVLAAAAIVAKTLINQQYYVGTDDKGTVTIYQGIRGSVLGISLNSAVGNSCTGPDGGNTCGKSKPLNVRDLQEVYAGVVNNGFPVNSRDEAVSYIQCLVTFAKTDSKKPDSDNFQGCVDSGVPMSSGGDG